MEQARRIAILAEELRIELERLRAAMAALRTELAVLEASRAGAVVAPDDIDRFRDAVARDMLRLSSSVSLDIAKFGARIEQRLDEVRSGAETC